VGRIAVGLSRTPRRIPYSMEEHRSSSRRRIVKSGTISYGGADQIDCTVRNISETGACLQIESSVGIPNRFILVINKVIYLCHVEWRAGRRLGVRFDTP
jgi:hypothetical protein